MQEPNRAESDPNLFRDIAAATKKMNRQSPEGKLRLPTPETMPQFFKEVGEQLVEISGAWNPVKIYTPNDASLKQEKARFLADFDAGEVYQPHFTYSAAEEMDVTQSRDQLLSLKRHVRSLPIDRKDRLQRIARVVLARKIDDDLATCDLVDGIKTKDESLISSAMRRKYRGTNPELTKKAQEDYARRTLLEDALLIEQAQGLLTEDERAYLANTKLHAEQIKAAFEWALARLGILRSPGSKDHGFQVLVESGITSIDVRDKTADGPTVFIPTDRVVSAEYLLALIEHEIGAHARQSMNGEKMFGIGGGALKLDDETLYEGLAKRHEALYYKRMYGRVLDNFNAPYVLAVATAEQGGSFHDIFSEQLALRLHVALTIAPEQPLPPASDIAPSVYDKAKNAAWLTTYRVMRGHVDMSNPTNTPMAKDLAYFRGTLLDEQLALHGLEYLNEAAILTGGGLQALAEFELTPEDLPFQATALGEPYWLEVLKPEYKRQLAAHDVRNDN